MSIIAECKKKIGVRGQNLGAGSQGSEVGGAEGEKQ